MNKQLLITSLKALTAAVLSAAVLLFVFAFAALRSDDPGKNLALFAYITIPVSAAVGGVFCTKSDNRRLSALLFSAEYILISLVFGCMFGTVFKNPLFTCACYFIIFLIPYLISSGSNAKKKKSKARKKYLKTR